MKGLLNYLKGEKYKYEAYLKYLKRTNEPEPKEIFKTKGKLEFIQDLINISDTNNL